MIVGGKMENPLKTVKSLTVLKDLTLTQRPQTMRAKSAIAYLMVTTGVPEV